MDACDRHFIGASNEKRSEKTIINPSCLHPFENSQLRYFQSLMLAKRVLSPHEEAIAEGAARTARCSEMTKVSPNRLGNK